MCQQGNAVMYRFKHLLDGGEMTETDRILLKGRVDLLSDEAVRRGRYELAVMLELNDERISNARYTAERFEDALDLDAKIRLFHAFRKVDDEIARTFQHRWKISMHLPKRLHR